MCETLIKLFRHNFWANQRLIDACEGHSDAQLDATAIGMYGSIRATLVHLVGAQERYVATLTEADPIRVGREKLPFPGLAELSDGARESDETLVEFVARVQSGATVTTTWRPGSAGGQVRLSPGSPRRTLIDEKRRNPIARSIRVTLAALMLAIFATGTVHAQHATPTPGTAPSWLMIQAFDAATLRVDSTTHALTLVLTGVDPAVLAFTDRPNRKVATVQTADFAHLVAEAQADPLNATLVAPLASGPDVMLVLELRNAEIAASGESVTYQVTVLAQEDQTPDPAATPITAQNDEVAFGGGHLFVDDVQVPIDVPVNVCGNTVGVVGLLNPAAGNTCVNQRS